LQVDQAKLLLPFLSLLFTAYALSARATTSRNEQTRLSTD
jgi:hypothetical protein